MIAMSRPFQGSSRVTRIEKLPGDDLVEPFWQFTTQSESWVAPCAPLRPLNPKVGWPLASPPLRRKVGWPLASPLASPCASPRHILASPKVGWPLVRLASPKVGWPLVRPPLASSLLRVHSRFRARDTEYRPMCVRPLRHRCSAFTHGSALATPNIGPGLPPWHERTPDF
jgi:hypothetical protein